MRIKPDYADNRFPGGSLVHCGGAVDPESAAQFDGGDSLLRQIGHNLQGCRVIADAYRGQFHAGCADDRPVLGRIGAWRHKQKRRFQCHCRIPPYLKLGDGRSLPASTATPGRDLP